MVDISTDPNLWLEVCEGHLASKAGTVCADPMGSSTQPCREYYNRKSVEDYAIAWHKVGKVL